VAKLTQLVTRPFPSNRTIDADLLVGCATRRLTAIGDISGAGRAPCAALASDRRESVDCRPGRTATPLVTGALPAGLRGAGAGEVRGARPRGEPGGSR